MRHFYVTDSQDGKPVEQVTSAKFKHLTKNALFKALRKKDIKVNGTRVKEGHIVHTNDLVEVFIIDQILFGTNQGMGFTVVFEDENILIVNKEQGVPVHSDRISDGSSLIERVSIYLNQGNKGEKIKPFLCHRLDRNTGGLVMIAKNKATLDTIIEKMDANQIIKTYKCTVIGRPRSKHATMHAFLTKDEKIGKVYISDTQTPGALEITTIFTLLRGEKIAYKDTIIDTSDLEVQIPTGRTHQIRAHLAAVGLPVLGDGKYGINDINRALGYKKQQLFATQLYFDFQGDCKHLGYLRGAKFNAEEN